MNIFTKIFRSNKNAKSPLKDITDYRSRADYETQTDSISFACIDRIAAAVAGLSYGIYDTRTKQKVKHNLIDVLKNPNLDETHNLFFTQIVKDYYGNGNVFLYLYKDVQGNVTNIFRLDPSAVYVSRDPVYNQKQYRYNGTTYSNRQVIHIIARFGYNGLRGISIFDENRTAFETSRALDSYTDYSFKNQIGGKRLMIDISKAYPNATQDEINLLRAKYIKDYSGVENAGKPVVKTGSIDFNTIEGSDIDNRSQQLQEIKNYQQNLISELFGIPTDYLTGNTNNLESISTLFIQNAIEPICKSLEESFEKLFTPVDRERYYFEFNLNSLYRTNLQAKIDAYTKQLNNGMLSVNEIRSKENLTPVEAGDYHFVPANLLPLTEENVSAILAKSKLALIEADQKTKQENAEGAGTITGLGSDKS